MSNDNDEKKAKPAAAAELEKAKVAELEKHARKDGPPRPMEPIPIRTLRFCRQFGLEVPIPSPHGGHLTMVHSLTTGKINAGQVEIALLPWIRQFRVVYREEGAAPRSFLIPEGWALSEPVET